VVGTKAVRRDSFALLGFFDHFVFFALVSWVFIYIEVRLCMRVKTHLHSNIG